MADYIDKEQLKHSVKQYFKYLIDKGKYKIDVLDANADIHKIISELPAIERLPAADVVSKETHEAVVKALQAFAETDVTQVVRCGKCTDYMPKSGICWRRSFPMSPDDYCSKGTRRAE
jgi:hypothetical protein